MNKTPLPVLYSFRRCPYAIRARMAIKNSNIDVALREVVLADKPGEMLLISPKGTVPVLELIDGTIIDESREIMSWALTQNHPDNWFPKTQVEINESDRLIEINDNEFKQYLDRYKYADRFPEYPVSYYREQAKPFLQLLESKLSQHKFLLSDNITFADIAIFPFVRQFALVDKNWFDDSGYIKLKNWLDNFINSSLFNTVMKKYPQWQPADEVIRF